MEPRLTDDLKIVFFLIILLSTGSSENDLSWKFCGTWRHGKDSLNLNVSLSRGCDGISVSANESSLSITGQITAQCRRFDVIPFKQFGLDSENDIRFCLYWEPLLDLLNLQIEEKNHTLCYPASLQDSCCTDLSYGANTAQTMYGIFDGEISNDFITHKTLTAYNFAGHSTNCKALCDQASQGSPCAHTEVVKMEEHFRGINVTSPAIASVSSKPVTTVYLPPALKEAAKNTNEAVCTFFTSNSLFQVFKTVKILNDVVEITVENKIIIDLSEPIRIDFHHDVISKMYSRKCVSWDTRKDPLQVNWLGDGCETRQKGANHTECLCNHLTYFTVLVQLEARPVRHLLVLTTITYVGCAVSFISCIGLIIFLYRKRRRSKEQSMPIHLGLALSLAFLSLLFFFTGVLANVGGQSLCVWVGAVLHYALLSSLTWMGIEVFHTFWLVYMVFSPAPKPYVWNVVGFVLPAVPIVILAAVGGIYGLREVVSVEDESNPYKMCWMTDTPEAFLAHCFTNVVILAMLVLSGIVMLFHVYREIRTRDEWKQNRVAFLSIWGLSCLFGTTWGLGFLRFGSLSVFIDYFFCILNSFQGFFLMLRFCMLDWMRKQASGSALGSTSTGSTRQHMLQAQERS